MATDINGTALLDGPIDFGDPLPFDAPVTAFDAPVTAFHAPAEATAPPPSLTFPQYASLCAECAVHPEQLPAIRTRYGIVASAQHRALEAHWKVEFEANPELRREHERLVAEYTDWMRMGGSR